MRAILSIVITLSVALSGFVPAYAGGYVSPEEQQFIWGDHNYEYSDGGYGGGGYGGNGYSGGGYDNWNRQHRPPKAHFDDGRGLALGAIGFAAGMAAGAAFAKDNQQRSPQPVEPYYDGPPADLQWNVSPLEGDMMGRDYFPPAPKK